MKNFVPVLSATIFLFNISIAVAQEPHWKTQNETSSHKDVGSPNSSNIRWDSLDHPIYADPDDNFAKDPSILHADGKYYMFYTGSLPGFQGSSSVSFSQLEYATSDDAIHWKKGGVIFKADADTWEAGRVQAPSRPVFHNGLWYMFYSGGPRKPKNTIYTGYATSTDLIHWQKAGQIAQTTDRANDVFIYEDADGFVMFYTTYAGHEIEPIYMRRSKDLINWSSPEPTGAEGEGTIVWKEAGKYFLLSCVGYSGKGEVYQLHSSSTLTGFKDEGIVNMKVPAFASDAFGHGDILKRGDEVWFYFQGTSDGGKSFQVGLAKHKISQ